MFDRSIYCAEIYLITSMLRTLCITNRKQENLSCLREELAARATFYTSKKRILISNFGDSLMTKKEIVPDKRTQTPIVQNEYNFPYIFNLSSSPFPFLHSSILYSMVPVLSSSGSSGMGKRVNHITYYL
jgi:hypothetical protein